ncbi:hypothetical protein [Clostridium beijerinckii]|uniref:Uncharacterized protein n=1 Tax=Clostridium beijerinckii TaxID=1520 RepID=A0AAW3WDW1_CLOBE|nr:hypothetical protein [Clostridium beijerinckii]MBC2459393.1 hypothetical protein [Clostridium beijerinckii]MBC2476911.1 hypothetical protein [Clostridium beijerinckii]NOV62727.1 hypothetical protein [Clostridium beijerinckii]NOV70311.1 hypothetical protein [Clostridium beijerinckii]NOW30781.1 hypothetical protein [Clostridium beijerinckii]
MSKHESEFIEFRYNGRKFNFKEVDMNGFLFGLRFNFPNESYLYLNGKLDKRKKQLIRHNLITGRGSRKITFETKECNHYEQ